MSRTYSPIAKDNNVTGLLDTLVDASTSPTDYADTLFQLGKTFGEVLSQKLNNSQTVTLACTVEDADYLCRGILEQLNHHSVEVRLVVFWNKRFNAGSEIPIPVAPILKEYHEDYYDQSNVIVVVKSIISSSCVVRTNLTHLIERTIPQQIFVVAPVLLKGATIHLEQEFDRSISEKFEYLYFAEDSESNQQGIVFPGIGGDVYVRLGYENQADKNRYVPQLVKERRKAK